MRFGSRYPTFLHDVLTQKAQGGAVAAKIAGSVSGIQLRKSARGNRFAFVQLSDPTGLYEVTVFSDTLEKYGELLEAGQNVVLAVEANIESDQLKLLARSVQPVDGAVEGAAAAGLRVFVNDSAAPASVRDVLARGEGKARSPVNIMLLAPDLPGEVEIPLHNAYAVTPQIIAAIKHVAGVSHVEEF